MHTPQPFSNCNLRIRPRVEPSQISLRVEAITFESIVGRIINIAPQYHYAIWPQYGFLSAIEDLEKLIFDGVKGIRFHGPP